MTRRSRAKVRIVYHVTITEVTTTSRTGEPDVVDALELLKQEKGSLDFDAVVRAVNGLSA